ncbi:MAG: hypothetical protein P8Z37_18700 [Acidobacteriota bacterium]
MGKTNWGRWVLGGLVAAIVLNIIYYVILGISGDTPGVVWFRFYSIPTGLTSVWLYSAIRPRYGAGPKTAILAGSVIGMLCGFTYVVSGFAFPARTVLASGLSFAMMAFFTVTAMYVVATLAGAWVYKEQE